MNPSEQHRIDALALDPDARARLLSKLRGEGVRDARVLDAMSQVPRECFVDPALRDRAYLDTALPIACDQTISQPTVVAWMTAALDVGPRDTVLEIGTGSGYQAAVLARLAGEVFTIERHAALAETAQARLRELGIANVRCRVGDGTLGWPEAAPFDRIIVTAAAEEVPPALFAQLRPGGVLVAPVGSEYGDQVLLRYTKDASGAVRAEHLMNVRFVPLIAG